jgi:nucleoside-diphosphate-sugar epimerase
MSGRALVTGATGFLGGALARRLARTGWEVCATGRRPMLERDGIAFISGNLENAAFIAEACKGVDVVFHCAALSSPWGRERDFVAANITGTENVVAGCLKHGIARLVHVSTPSLYFDFRDRLNLSEAAPFAVTPVNAYARTKLMAERVVDAAAERGLDAVTVRPRAIFGPGDTTLFPRLMRIADRFPLVGNGDPLIEVSYIDNVVAALITAATTANISGQKFNITNGEPLPRSELLDALFRSVGVPFHPRPVRLGVALGLAGCMELLSRIFTASRWEPPLTRYSAGVLAFSQTFDLSAARKSLGYTASVSVADGLDAFAEWWRSRR